MKLLIFGNSGSGKSTLARKLAAEHQIAHLDLDSIVWEPETIAVPRATAKVHADLSSFIDAHENWVIEGCYGELISAASSSCTDLLFLNPGLEACLRHNQSRPWEPHKYQSKEAQDSMLENLQAWVAGYYERKDDWSYHAHRRIFDTHTGGKRELTDPHGESATNRESAEVPPNPSVELTPDGLRPLAAAHVKR